MSWRDLLPEDDYTVTAAWIGSRSLYLIDSKWTIEGPLPPEHGWHEFTVTGRKVRWKGRAEPGDHAMVGYDSAMGYLVGDLFVGDMEGGKIKDPAELMGRFERVNLVEPGIDHFARVHVARFWADGPLVYVGQEFPLGPEGEVLDAFLSRVESLKHISGVVPALDLTFRMKTWHRAEVDRRRAEEAARREAALAEARRAQLREERDQKIRETLGDGEIRRQLALEDFQAAATAALAVGGAEYVGHRRSHTKGEFVVQYMVDSRRYECVCDQTMHIIDAGICLHDSSTGEKGDTYFTLESLPGVTRAAMAEGAAIWRHV